MGDFGKAMEHESNLDISKSIGKVSGGGLAGYRTAESRKFMERPRLLFQFHFQIPDFQRKRFGPSKEKMMKKLVSTPNQPDQSET